MRVTLEIIELGARNGVNSWKLMLKLNGLHQQVYQLPRIYYPLISTDYLGTIGTTMADD